MNEKESEQRISVLKFYREEVKHELNLLSLRVTWFVTCQSFLITASVLLFVNKKFTDVLPIALLGIIISISTIFPIEAADRTIEQWLKKQNSFFIRNPCIAKNYSIERNLQPLAQDKDHQHGLLFARLVPYLFLSFWSIWLLDIWLGSGLWFTAPSSLDNSTCG